MFEIYHVAIFFSGSMPPRFTFLRAESMREAALANRNMTLKQTQYQTTSVVGTSQFCQEPLAVQDNGESFPGCSEKVREVDQECNHGKFNVEIEGLENKNMGKVASSAVRKLFNDNLPVETTRPSLSSSDFNEGDSLDELPIYHGELGGLSYVNSQEPGELSQINALDYVDRFLKNNIVEFDQETNRVKNVEKKSESLPSTKWKQSLLKRVNDRSKATKAEIYDWDDSREDEGGGDIFSRRKEDFFEDGTQGPRSLPGFRKIKSRRPNDDKDEEERSNIPDKRKTAVHSDSKLGMHNLKIRDNTIQEITRELKRNLANELDEQLNSSCSRGEMEPNANEDGQEMLDVGLDTQMAAEAMEALCNTGDIVDHVANDAARVTRSRSTYQLNNSSIGKRRAVTSNQHSGQYDRKRKVDVKSDLQTSDLSKKCTKKIGQCKKDNVMSRSKKSKLNAEGNRNSSANKNSRIISSPIIEQRKAAGALKRHRSDELNNPDGHDGGSTVNEKQIQGEVCHFTPISRRTRQSLAAVNQLINCDIASKRLKEGTTGIAPKSSGIGLQASKALDPKSTRGSSDHFEVDDNTKLCQLEKLAPKANAVSVGNGTAMDALDCPRRRRSLRIIKLSNHDKGSEKLVGSSKPSAQAEDIGAFTSGKKKKRTEKDIPICCDAMNEKGADLNSNVKNNADVLWSTNNFEVISSDESPRDRCKSSDLATATPANCKTPVNDASPVCMGDDYYMHNKNLPRSCLLKVFRKELQRELRSLSAIRPELITPSKDSRKRKDMTDVRILYSHHLDEDIIKHQKKVMSEF